VPSASHSASRSARIERELRASGLSLPDDAAVQYAVEFAAQLVSATVPSAEVADRRRSALLGALCRRTQLSTDAAARLLAIVEMPENRARLQASELAAYIARFGEAAGREVLAAEQADLGLDAFGRRFGGAHALLLLDSLFAVFADGGRVQPDDLMRLSAAAELLGIDPVLFSTLYCRHDVGLASGAWSVPLVGDTIRLGRSTACEVLLGDPRVAMRHADLKRTAQGWRVVDAESGRPTVLNGRPVTAAPLAPGDELRIGPFVTRLNAAGDVLEVTGERSFSALSMRHLTRKIGEVSLLDDVSFTVFSGEVIAMIGPSGCGKTTLLNAIAGVTPAQTGTVTLDDLDFHAELAAERESVGIVPQDDIVHPELSVEESLRFGARLRLPAGSSAAQVQVEVDRVLGELGIEHIRASRIGDAIRRGISGGQRKRVNLGQELLARTMRVLFLDEPTSGLDPRASQDIVRLVRQLADRGRIVFVVTHDLTPQIVAQVDHLIVLAPGGRLAYFGPPTQACRYFGVATPDAIFNRFSDRQPAEWGAAYRSSDDARTFVAMREELRSLDGAERRGQAAPARAPLRRPGGWAQLATLMHRYAKVKSRDLGGLTVLMAQAPVLAAVMWIVFPLPTREMMFMLSLSCLWFGMSASVRELISDRVIWLRERRIGVRPAPYVWSKTYVLGALVGAQCAAFAVMNLVLHPALVTEYGTSVAGFVGVSAVTGLVGMALGLAVSAANSSSEGAVGSLPLLLIPQIAFSGVLLSLRRMSTLAGELTWWNPARFAYDALLKTGEKLGAPRSRGLDWDAMPLSGTLYNLGFKGDGASDLGLSMLELLSRLGLFAALFLLTALAVVQRRRE
jgi:ABC-type multidrug transport system ATPase subunit